MPHIELPDLPGIAGLLMQFPQTAGPLNALAEALLRGPSPLTPAERETIAAYVSSRNGCTFCAETHGAVARRLHASTATSPAATVAADTVAADTVAADTVASGPARAGADPAGANPAGADPAGADPADADPAVVDVVSDVVRNGERASVDARMRALLVIAEKVRVDGRSVDAADVDRAREGGADDRAIHDTVLIAAAFCMFNRYVDGLATMTPASPQAYAQHARHLAVSGYLTGAPRA